MAWSEIFRSMAIIRVILVYLELFILLEINLNLHFLLQEATDHLHLQYRSILDLWKKIRICI